MKTSQFITLIAAAAALTLTSCTKEYITPEGPEPAAAAYKVDPPQDNSGDYLPPKPNPERAYLDHDVLPEKTGDNNHAETPVNMMRAHSNITRDQVEHMDTPGIQKDSDDKVVYPVSELKERKKFTLDEVKLMDNDPSIDPFQR